MKKLMIIAGAVALAGIMTGCQSVSVGEKVATWQNERPYAEKIKEVQASGRQLQSRDVDLVFTMDDFKKSANLPEAAASIEAVMAVGKGALNVVAEIGNTTSPLYVAAVDSVDRKWAMYSGRDLEAQAKAQTDGDVEKYIGTLPAEYQESARKDYATYQKVINNVPDPAVLAKGKEVCERYISTVTAEDGTQSKVLDVVSIEALQYTDETGQAEYSAFCLYRDNTPEVQEMCDSAMMAKLTAVLANIQAQLTDMLNSVAKLQEDPEVSKLGAMDLLKTLKGVGVGVGAAFADPVSKISSAIKGYSLASDIDKLAAETQTVEQAEADKAKKD